MTTHACTHPKPEAPPLTWLIEMAILTYVVHRFRLFLFLPFLPPITKGEVVCSLLDWVPLL